MTGPALRRIGTVTPAQPDFQSGGAGATEPERAPYSREPNYKTMSTTVVKPEIIKEYKGGFTARVYQTVAFFFSSNLKQPYDAQGNEREMPSADDKSANC